MESGYGKRPIDRDLKTGNAVPPPEITPPLPEPARQHSTQLMEGVVTSAPDAEMQSEYKPADIDTISIPTSDIRTTLESPPESRTPRLKDPDLDEVMTPPPGEEDNEPRYSSIEHAFSRDFTVDAPTLGDLRHRSDAIEVDAKLDNGVDLQVMCATELEPINDKDHAEVDMSEVELRKGKVPLVLASLQFHFVFICSYSKSHPSWPYLRSHKGPRHILPHGPERTEATTRVKCIFFPSLSYLSQSLYIARFLCTYLYGPPLLSCNYLCPLRLPTLP